MTYNGVSADFMHCNISVKGNIWKIQIKSDRLQNDWTITNKHSFLSMYTTHTTSDNICTARWWNSTIS